MITILDLKAEFEKLTLLRGRTPQTTEVERKGSGAFATLAPFRDGNIFSAKFAGDGAWERHPNGDELAAHATQERFVYYHRWRVGDVLIWDERATMHRGAGDYRPDERRIMLRTIVYPS